MLNHEKTLSVATICLPKLALNSDGKQGQMCAVDTKASPSRPRPRVWSGCLNLALTICVHIVSVIGKALRMTGIHCTNVHQKLVKRD